jgi:cutinase-like protein
MIDRVRSCAIFLAIAGLIALVAPTVPVANAAGCPDVELVFARGRLEPPGAGQIGNALLSALRAKSKKNITMYAVNYPADTQVDIGANDMSQHIQNTMANCPNTRVVVGGYSLGAAVSDVVLAVPFSFFTFKNPLPDGAEQHIAAVALFGNGSQWVGPISTFSPVYKERTIELCHGDDPICNPTQPDNWQAYWPDHLAPAYIKAGMVNQAADFVAGRI